MRRLLGAKLRPPALPRTAVARPRIERELERLAGRHPIVLVVAAPGAGKTTAAAQFAARAGRPAAWLTLDEGDRLPGRFVTYLAAAIAAVEQPLGGEVLAMLEDGLAPAECAAMLGERMAPRSLAVLDDLHHLAGGEEALGALRAFLRHLGPGRRALLVSRRLPALGLERDALAARVGGVFDQDLAFTVEEAERLLAARGGEADAGALQRATGGWAAGLVFDSLAESGARPPLPPGQDPLFAYLGAELFEGLAERLREALLASSVLDLVTPERLARLLDEPGAVGLFDELCAQHLPATVETGSLRYHPRFREFLEVRLRAERPGWLRELTARYGRMLAEEGYLEEAADALLRAGRGEEAEPLAERATGRLIRRGDWDKVIAWSEALGEPALRRRGALRGAQLHALLLARRQRELEELVHGMLASGEVERLAAEAPDALGWAVWALHASGEWAKLLPLLPGGAGGRAGVVRHLFRVSASPDPAPELPEEMLGRRQPLHVALQSALYYQGRFEEVERLAAVAAAGGPVTAALGQIFRIAVLRERGDLAGARRALEAVAPRVRASRYLEFWHQVEAELACDEGRPELGLELAREARRLSREHLYRIGDRAIFAVTEGRLLVRMGRAAEGAEILEGAGAWCAERGLLSFREWADAWLGAARLLAGGDPGAALAPLRAATAGMARAGRRLELPAAAVFLAEAQWRAGDERAHDAACDLALEAAEAQGTLEPLRRALALFPEVAPRRVDSGGAPEPWRRLLRAAGALAPPPPPGRRRLRVHSFGEGSLELDSGRVRVGLAKAVALAAWLAAAGERGVARERIVAEVFDGSDDGQNYLRQVVHRLRRALPEGVALRSVEGRLAWSPAEAVLCDDRDFEALVARARVELGPRRIETLRRAIALCGAGPYLDGVEGEAIEARRRQLAGLEAEARAELAQGLLEAGRAAEARAVARTALDQDPFREGAWQLLMRAEADLGGPEAVGPVLSECRRALAEAGLEPCAATMRLVARLRGPAAPRSRDEAPPATVG